jgi:hypothetical protein
MKELRKDADGDLGAQVGEFKLPTLLCGNSDVPFVR